MAQAVYHFPPSLHERLARKRADLTAKFKAGLLRAEEVRQEYARYMLTEMRGGLQETREDRLIECVCERCGQAHRMAGTVRFYRCACSPHIERPSFRGRSF